MAGKKGNTNKPIDGEKRDIDVKIRFSRKELDEIEKIAKDLEIPRARLIRNLALAGLEDANILKKTGILKGVKKFIDFKERFKNPEKYQALEVT